MALFLFLILKVDTQDPDQTVDRQIDRGIHCPYMS